MGLTYDVAKALLQPHLPRLIKTSAERIGCSGMYRVVLSEVAVGYVVRSAGNYSLEGIDVADGSDYWRLHERCLIKEFGAPEGKATVANPRYKATWTAGLPRDVADGRAGTSGRLTPSPGELTGLEINEIGDHWRRLPLEGQKVTYSLIEYESVAQEVLQRAGLDDILAEQAA